MRSDGWSTVGSAAETTRNHETPRASLGWDDRLRESAPGRREGPARETVPALGGPVLLPPALLQVVGRVEVRLHDTECKVVMTLPATIETFGPKDAGCARAVARWSIVDFAPNTFFATARVASRTGKTLTCSTA
jgi:hypothetical protein